MPRCFTILVMTVVAIVTVVTVVRVVTVMTVLTKKKKSPNKIILKQIYILQTKLSIKYISKDNFSIFADLQISKIPIGLTKISGEAL